MRRPTRAGLLRLQRRGGGGAADAGRVAPPPACAAARGGDRPRRAPGQRHGGDLPRRPDGVHAVAARREELSVPQGSRATSTSSCPTAAPTPTYLDALDAALARAVAQPRRRAARPGLLPGRCRPARGRPPRPPEAQPRRAWPSATAACWLRCRERGMPVALSHGRRLRPRHRRHRGDPAAHAACRPWRSGRRWPRQRSAFSKPWPTTVADAHMTAITPESTRCGRCRDRFATRQCAPSCRHRCRAQTIEDILRRRFACAVGHQHAALESDGADRRRKGVAVATGSLAAHDANAAAGSLGADRAEYAVLPDRVGLALHRAAPQDRLGPVRAAGHRQDRQGRHARPARPQLPLLRRAGRPDLHDRPHPAPGQLARLRHVPREHHGRRARPWARHLSAGRVPRLSQDHRRASRRCRPAR